MEKPHKKERKIVEDMKKTRMEMKMISHGICTNSEITTGGEPGSASSAKGAKMRV